MVQTDFLAANHVRIFGLCKSVKNAKAHRADIFVIAQISWFSRSDAGQTDATDATTVTELRVLQCASLANKDVIDSRLSYGAQLGASVKHTEKRAPPSRQQLSLAAGQPAPDPADAPTQACPPS